MNPKPAKYTELFNRDARTTAHIAARARLDTIYGGCKALNLAARMKRSRIDAEAIVSDVYSASTGKHHREHEAWSCPECGSVHLGIENAANCCVFQEEDFC